MLRDRLLDHSGGILDRFQGLLGLCTDCWNLAYLHFVNLLNSLFLGVIRRELLIRPVLLRRLVGLLRWLLEDYLGLFVRRMAIHIEHSLMLGGLRVVLWLNQLALTLRGICSLLFLF